MALPAPLSAVAIEVPLRFEKKSGEAGLGFNPGMFTPGKPSGNVKLPAFNSVIPQYALLRFGDKPVLVVLDTRNKGERLLSRLHIDRNGNGDLTEDPPIDGVVRKSRSGSPTGVDFPAIDVMIQVDGVPMPYRFRMSLRNVASKLVLAGKTGMPFLCMASCAYEGMFTLGESAYAVLVCDGNGNGRFDDPATIVIPQGPSSQRIYPKGDYIFLYDGGQAGQYDAQPLGNMLWLRDRLYWVKLDIAKATMSIAEFPGGLTPVNLSMAPDQLTLFEENSGRFVMVHRPAAKTLALPSGRYRLVSYQAYRKDEKGALWRLQATGMNISPAMTVQPGQIADFPLGEPYTPVITFPNLGHGRIIPRRVNLNLNLTGSANEMVASLTVIEQRNTAKRPSVQFPEKPAYTIIKSDGRLAARGSFEYG